MKKIFLCFLLFGLEVLAEPLVLKFPSFEKSFSTKTLLKKSKKISLEKDPSYGLPKTYLAIDLKTFIRSELGAKKMPAAESNILFVAKDGFEVVIPAKLLFYTHGVDPYLAVENPRSKWPVLKKKGVSAGPYYLIWKGDTQKVGQEYWAYMVTKIEYQKKFTEAYPKTVPNTKKKSVWDGYRVFQRNCFACHSFNGEGGDKMGPDLNRPHSPAEYMVKKYFFKYIRDPQSLRTWLGSQMSSFSKEVISDKELDELWKYLDHMSKIRH